MDEQENSRCFGGSSFRIAPSPNRFRLCVLTCAFTLFDTLDGAFAGGNIIAVVGFGLRALPNWR